MPQQKALPEGFTLEDSSVPSKLPPGMSLETSNQTPVQHKVQTGVEDFLRAAGVPESPSQIPTLLQNLLLPTGNPAHPTTGESIPLIGPILTASQEVLDVAPKTTIPEKITRAIGSIPLIGPPFYAGTKALKEGNYPAAAGSLANIALQTLGAKGKPTRLGSAESALKEATGKAQVQVPYTPNQAVKPGTVVTNKPGALGSILAAKFDLRPDYAKNIEEKTRAITEAKKEAQSATQNAARFGEEETKQIQGRAQFTRNIIDQVRDKTIQDLESQLGSLEKQRHSIGSQLIADTAKAAHEEYQRVSQPFVEIGEQIKGNISDSRTIQGLIESAVVEEGGRIPEIPPAAFKALPTKSEPVTTSATGEFVVPEGAGLGGLPPKGVTFDTLTRAKEDLFSTAGASKDTAIRRGLYKAAEKISDLQQKIANDNGLGEKYKSAKGEYMKFRRGIGSTKAEKLLSAKDVFDQAVDPKLSKVVGKATTEGINTILQSVGISSSELSAINTKIGQVGELLKGVPKEAQAESKAISKAESERISGVEKATREAQSEAEKSAGERIKKEQKYGGEVIKGKTTEELAGIDNVTLNRMKLAMQAKGVANPFALFQILYGLSIMAHSPLYGALHVGYGVGRSMPLEVLMNDARFQDWVLKKSGITPQSPAASGIRQGLRRATKVLAPAAAPQALKPTGVAAALTPQAEPEETEDEFTNRNKD